MQSQHNVVEDRRKVPARKYRRIRCLGKGSFATCYELRCVETHAAVAAKVFPKAATDKQREQVRILKHEISIQKGLEHPNVVRYIDHFDDPENHYILLEVCPHGSLRELLDRRRRLSEPEVKYFMRQLMYAIEHVHAAGFVHRDVKTSNLLLDQHLRLKLSDFGLAARVTGEGHAAATEVSGTGFCGTPSYIAPEVLRTRGRHGAQSDVWAAGVVMYTLLAGVLPFDGKSTRETYANIREAPNSLRLPQAIGQPAKALLRQLLRSMPAERATIQVRPARSTSLLLSPTLPLLLARRRHTRRAAACAHAGFGWPAQETLGHEFMQGAPEALPLSALTMLPNCRRNSSVPAAAVVGPRGRRPMARVQPTDEAGLYGEWYGRPPATAGPGGPMGVRASWPAGAAAARRPQSADVSGSSGGHSSFSGASGSFTRRAQWGVVEAQAPSMALQAAPAAAFSRAGHLGAGRQQQQPMADRQSAAQRFFCTEPLAKAAAEAAAPSPPLLGLELQAAASREAAATREAAAVRESRAAAAAAGRAKSKAKEMVVRHGSPGWGGGSGGSGGSGGGGVLAGRPTIANLRATTDAWAGCGVRRSHSSSRRTPQPGGVHGAALDGSVGTCELTAAFSTRSPALTQSPC